MALRAGVMTGLPRFARNDEGWLRGMAAICRCEEPQATWQSSARFGAERIEGALRADVMTGLLRFARNDEG